MSTSVVNAVRRTPRDEPPFEPLPLDECNLFVKYLPSNVDDNALFKMFEPFGRIVSAKVMMHPQRNTSLGYGFVRYAESHEADAAVENMNGIVVQNKIILVRKSNSESSRKHASPSSVVYVSPIPPNVSAAAIAEEFSRFGAVQSCRLYDSSPTSSSSSSVPDSRRIAFISYGSVQHAQKAIDEIDGGHLDCCDQPDAISVRFAYKKKKTNEKDAPEVMNPLNHRQQNRPLYPRDRNAHARPSNAQRPNQMSGNSQMGRQQPRSMMMPASGWNGNRQHDRFQQHLDNAGLVDALSMLSMGGGVMPVPMMNTMMPVSSGVPRYHVSNGDNGVPDSASLGTRIQIIGICQGVSRDELYRILRPYGEIEHLDFVYDSGYCIVTYHHHHEAVYAMRALHGLPLGDDVLAVSWDV